MSDVDRIWAGWRSEYIEKGPHSDCVFCGLLKSDLPARETNIVWRDDIVAVLLNAYPYVSGHVLVMPLRHVKDLELLTAEEQAGLWNATTDAVRAIKSAVQRGLGSTSE